MVLTKRKEILDYVFSILEIPEEAATFFREEWQIKSVGMLINLEHEKMLELEEVAHGHVAAIALVTEWIKQYIETNDGELPNWEEDLTEETWEDFILCQGAKKGGGISTTTEEGSDTSKDINQDNVDETIDTIESIDPVIKIGNSPFNNAMPMVKIDVRSYPEFDGTLKNWKSYKQKFKSVASMHGLGDLVNSTYQVPSGPKELENHYMKNGFLQSILEYSLAKGTALTRVKKFSKIRDGRESWKELAVWYEGQGSTETLARKALTTITTHQLTHSSFGGAESYLEKFETALQDLVTYAGDRCRRNTRLGCVGVGGLFVGGYQIVS